MIVFTSESFHLHYAPHFKRCCLTELIIFQTKARSMIVIFSPFSVHFPGWIDIIYKKNLYALKVIYMLFLLFKPIRVVVDLSCTFQGNFPLRFPLNFESMSCSKVPLLYSVTVLDKDKYLWKNKIHLCIIMHFCSQFYINLYLWTVVISRFSCQGCGPKVSFKDKQHFLARHQAAGFSVLIGACFHMHYDAFDKQKRLKWLLKRPQFPDYFLDQECFGTSVEPNINLSVPVGLFISKALYHHSAAKMNK